MLGNTYFSLVQSLHDSRSFEEIANLLTLQLPRQFEHDHATIALVGEGPTLYGIFGNSPSSKLGREAFGQVATQLPLHPLIGKVDLENPGNLGFVASKLLRSGAYGASAFNRGLPKAMQAADSMAGRLSTSWGRSALLFVCRTDGDFTEEDREVFDAVLFTARAVLERIAGQNVEDKVREFLLTRGAALPLCLFSFGLGREVLPMNHHAVRLSEKWWSQDEAYRELGHSTSVMIFERMHEAWTDPVVADFRSLEIDLGGGSLTMYGLPKQSGEVILIMPDPHSQPSSDVAVDAVLTKRQKEIMDWIAEGKTSAEAAIILDISPRTVEKHLEAVFQRLGVENRIAAVRRFLDLRAGLPV